MEEPPADERYPLPPPLESEVPVARPPEMVRKRGSARGLLAPPRDRARITRGWMPACPNPPLPEATAAAAAAAAAALVVRDASARADCREACHKGMRQMASPEGLISAHLTEATRVPQP